MKRKRLYSPSPRRVLPDGPVFAQDLRRAWALHVFCLRAFLTHDHLEGDLLPLVQGFEAFTQDGRVMDKNILTAVLGNKAQALLVVPPFDFAFSHTTIRYEHSA